MPNIKPISDLKNYSDVLRDVSVGAPVFLTKNGRGRYAIIDIQDYEKARATLKLMGELAKGKKSGETDGIIFGFCFLICRRMTTKDQTKYSNDGTVGSCWRFFAPSFIPASNEPSGHACMHIWRLQRGI